MNTLQSIWNGLDWSYLLNIVLSVVPALLCITFHEVSHGWVAYRLGDPTAKDAGRLTLNPIHDSLVGGRFLIVEVQDRHALAGRPRRTTESAVVYDRNGQGLGGGLIA